MLKLNIAEKELYDDLLEEFVTTKPCILNLEHSLVSISKWESKWCKPFLSKTQKTLEETIDYVRCMTISQNIDDTIYKTLSDFELTEIYKYIDHPSTATTFAKDRGGNKETITAEIIYHWMISFNIPIECQKWHINRLLTLIKVCNIKNQPKKKRSKNQILRRNSELNAQRKAQMKGGG